MASKEKFCVIQDGIHLYAERHVADSGGIQQALYDQLIWIESEYLFISIMSQFILHIRIRVLTCPIVCMRLF